MRWKKLGKGPRVGTTNLRGKTVLLPTRLIVRGLQFYWRLTRGLSLYAEACVVDAENRVLLVSGAAGSGWRLPTAEVLKGETLSGALRRILLSYGIEALAPPELFWIYAGPCDAGARDVRAGDAANSQTALSMVRQWRWLAPPPAVTPTFFGLEALPAGIAPKMAARIRQALEGRQPFEVC